jgi:carboxylesterase family protein
VIVFGQIQSGDGFDGGFDPELIFIFFIFSSHFLFLKNKFIVFGESESIMLRDLILLAIPFAAPPVGEFGLKSPQPPAAWEGVRELTGFGPDCPQAPYPQRSIYYLPPSNPANPDQFH